MATLLDPAFVASTSETVELITLPSDESAGAIQVTVIHAESAAEAVIPAREGEQSVVVDGPELREPIKASWDFDGHFVTVVERETGIFGSGVTLASAIEDFREALADHADALLAEAPLAPNLEPQMQFLRRYLRRL